MVFKVEGCWSGGNNHSWRITNRKGERWVLHRPGCDGWTRKTATIAKLFISETMGVRYDNIRFEHR